MWVTLIKSLVACVHLIVAKCSVFGRTSRIQATCPASCMQLKRVTPTTRDCTLPRFSYSPPLQGSRLTGFHLGGRRGSFPPPPPDPSTPPPRASPLSIFTKKMYTSMWFVILTACSMYTVLQLFRQAPGRLNS